MCMDSWKEGKFLVELENQPEKVAQLTQQMMLKLYPKGTRTGSSNMNPILGWSCGIQAVTMNMQTISEDMDVYDAMFIQVLLYIQN